MNKCVEEKRLRLDYDYHKTFYFSIIGFVFVVAIAIFSNYEYLEKNNLIIISIALDLVLIFLASHYANKMHDNYDKLYEMYSNES